VQGVAAGGFALQAEDPRRRDFRRALVVSLLAHGVLVGLFVVSPQTRRPALPGVIVVELVSLPAARFAPEPAPRPKARPAPVKKIVLPAEPTEQVPQAKPRPKLTPKPVAEPEEAPDAEYTDVMAQLREELGESAEPAEEVAPLPEVREGSAGSGSAQVSPEMAAWMRRAKIHVRRNWVLTPGFRTQSFEAHVRVNLDSSGRVLGEPRVTKRSGNPWYDDGVVRAIQKASPMPAPLEAGMVTFVFRPEDAY
jgi:TonB family protein